PTHNSPLSLHDALPISASYARTRSDLEHALLSYRRLHDILIKAVPILEQATGVHSADSLTIARLEALKPSRAGVADARSVVLRLDRKSTRLNSSHDQIS